MMTEHTRNEIEGDYVVLQEGCGRRVAADEWREVTLGDVMSFANGKSSPQRSDDSLYPVYGSNGIIGKCNKVNSDANTIVIGRVGSYCGSLHFSKKKCWITDNAIRAKAIGENDDKFIFYLLRTLGLNSWRAGSGQPLLNQTILSSIPTVIPPLTEQRSIAHVLGTLDDKIELNRRMNETLEAMAMALFKSWFVDFEPVRAKMEGRWRRGESLPGLPAELYDLFPDRLAPSELGEIPEGWEVRRLGDVVDAVGGATPSTKISEYWNGGKHCWATPKDLASLSVPVLLNTERMITDAGLNKIGSGLLPPRSILLSSRAPIGYVAITEIPVAINQGFIGIPPRQGVSNLFVLNWIQQNMEEIVNFANGSTFLEISKRNFRIIPIVVPGEAELAEFDNRVRLLHEHVVSNERESQSLADQRDALLPGLVGGKLPFGLSD